MSTIKKYNGSTWENTTARKYETKSEIITPPTTIYTDGTAITSYTIKGNTVQNGTPTPSAPIAVNGVGELVGSDYQIPISNGQQTTNIYLGSTQTVRAIKKYVLTGNETIGEYEPTYTRISIAIPELKSIGLRSTPCLSSHYIGIYDGRPIDQVPNNAIYSGGTGEVAIIVKENDYTTTATFRAYLQAQYAAGTPVTIWFAIPTPETAAVNEPLMKIRDYADTLSNATPIPTAEGANSITVDTTVQPSEFTATWTGWHDSSVKEWDGSDWQ